MKELFFDSEDPLDCYDNPNCFFNEDGIGMRREPGDPGYVPWSPGPEPAPLPRRPRRRRAALSRDQNPPTQNIPINMDQNLHFNVVPKPGGGYTTRIVTQEDLPTAELVASTQAALAARGITLTAEQIAAVGEELSKVRIAALARGRVVRRAFGYFTDEPTVGGVHADPDFLPTLDNMNPNVRTRLAPDGQALFESLIHFQREAVLGDKAPTVTRVYDATTRTTDRLTLGAPFRLTGPGDFGPEPDPAVTTLGVFLQRTGGTRVRVGVFSEWTPSEIFGTWPATLDGTGPAELRVVTQYLGNSQPSTFVYGVPITVS